jgi:hypothetical protein
MVDVEQYKSPSLGRVKSVGCNTWLEEIKIPDDGQEIVFVDCPECRARFLVKVRSRRRTLSKKLFVVASFLFIALFIIVFVRYATKKGTLLGYSLASPFVLLALWHFVNAMRGKFSPSDVVSHAGGRVHRILDEG